MLTCKQIQIDVASIHLPIKVHEEDEPLTLTGLKINEKWDLRKLYIFLNGLVRELNGYENSCLIRTTRTKSAMLVCDCIILINHKLYINYNRYYDESSFQHQRMKYIL